MGARHELKPRVWKGESIHLNFATADEYFELHGSRELTTKKSRKRSKDIFNEPLLETAERRQLQWPSHVNYRQLFIESFPQMCFKESGCRVGYEPKKNEQLKGAETAGGQGTLG